MLRYRHCMAAGKTLTLRVNVEIPTYYFWSGIYGSPICTLSFSHNEPGVQVQTADRALHIIFLLPCVACICSSTLLKDHTVYGHSTRFCADD